MPDFYTGLDAVPASSLKSDLFNKTAINSDGVKEVLGFYAAKIQTTYSTSIRTFPQGADFLIPFDTKLYDTTGFWSSNDATKLTTPVGLSYVELQAFVKYSTGNWIVSIYRNGTLIHSSDIGSTTNQYRYMTAKVYIQGADPGDYYQAYLQVAGSGTSNFDVDILQPDYTGTLITQTVQHQYASLTMRGYK